jgi:hypothetical protein
VIGERTREALAHKRRRSERAGPVPYGYDLAPDGRRLISNAAQQVILDQIRKSRAAGESYRLIADSLNADRIPMQGGGRWYAASVRSVIRTAARWTAAAGVGGPNDGSFTPRLPKSGPIRVAQTTEVPRPGRAPQDACQGPVRGAGDPGGRVETERSPHDDNVPLARSRALSGVLGLSAKRAALLGALRGPSGSLIRLGGSRCERGLDRRARGAPRLAKRAISASSQISP